MRRAQMSELIRSESFQSGPRSITTTFLLGRDRELAVDEMRDAVLPRPDRKRLADRFERVRFLGLEHAHGGAVCARLPRGEQNLGAADRKGECAKSRTERRALDEFSPRNL